MFTHRYLASEVPRDRQHGPPASSAWYAAARPRQGSWRRRTAKLAV